jgi:hypothetical protein
MADGIAGAETKTADLATYNKCQWNGQYKILSELPLWNLITWITERSWPFNCQ